MDDGHTVDLLVVFVDDDEVCVFMFLALLDDFLNSEVTTRIIERVGEHEQEFLDKLEATLCGAEATCDTDLGGDLFFKIC